MHPNSKMPPDATTASVLFHSRIEIGRILQGIADAGIAIYADIGDAGDEQMFVSSVLSVSPDTEHFAVDYAAEKAANSLLHRQPTIRFNAHYQGARISFLTRNPLDTMFQGKPAIDFPFPRSLLRDHREHRRIKLPRATALRCLVARPDAAPLEMCVVDISLDGMGCLVHTSARPMATGTLLQNCTILLPGGEAVRADLIVRYSTPVRLPNGTFAQRTGVRFVQRPDEIAALIRQFVQPLDDAEP